MQNGTPFPDFDLCGRLPCRLHGTLQGVCGFTTRWRSETTIACLFPTFSPTTSRITSVSFKQFPTSNSGVSNMSRREHNPFDVLGIPPTISLTPADVQRAYLIALSRVRQYANLVHVSGQVKQYRMPYLEAQLAAARDFFLSPIYIDEDNPARFNPITIDSILTNMSGSNRYNAY